MRLPLRVWHRARTAVLIRAFPKLFRAVKRDDLIRLGSSYGGWWVPRDALGRGSICYSAGVGEDVTFDLALVETFGCEVLLLDPTPRSAEYFAVLRLKDERLRFLPVGLARSSGIRRFFAPRDHSHVSYSMENLQGTSEYFEAGCQSLSDLMQQMSVRSIDLLKMDIEGAQHEVLDSIHHERIWPKVLCVEFDQPEPLRVTRRAVKRLLKDGYTLNKVEGFNMTFSRVHAGELSFKGAD